MKEDTDKFLIFIATLSLLFVLGDIFLWANISSQYTDAPALREAYLNLYPKEIRNIKSLCILPLVLLFIASLVFIRSARSIFLKTLLATLFAVLFLIIIWKMSVLI